MTKLKNPLLSLGAVGRLAKDLALRRSRKQNIIELAPFPFDAKSLAQLSWRHMYQKAIALWHALSAAEKLEWESLARRQHMTGFAWFISQALKPNPGLYLPLQGGTMAGEIKMATNPITGLPDPTAAQDPVTLAYLAAVLNFLSLTDTPAAYAGQALKGVRVNAAANALEFAALVGGYTEGARAESTGTILIPNAATTAVPFNAEEYDTDTIHDNAVNNSRLTCKTAGKYIIFACIEWGLNATGQRSVAFITSTGRWIAQNIVPANAVVGPIMVLVTTWMFSINQYVECKIYQNSGGNLNCVHWNDRAPIFGMQRIG